MIVGLFLAFVWKYIPETKGKWLEEIEIQLVGLSQKQNTPVAK